MKIISVVGGGAWGTALSLSFHRHLGMVSVRQFRRSQDVCTFLSPEALSSFSPVCIDTTLQTTTNFSELTQSDLILWVVPSQSLRGSLSLYKDFLPLKCPIILCSKGMEFSSTPSFYQQHLLYNVARSLVNNPLAVLSGPNFAIEVALDLPAASMIASPSEDLNDLCVELLNHPLFRIYKTLDITGVQLCGALKNIYAIVIGMLDGMKLGENARSALLTYCLSEMIRFGQEFGCDLSTFYGLSGLGDLILTASSPLSRNRMLGYNLGMGLSFEEVIQTSQLTEGFHTIRPAFQIAKKHEITTPILDALYKIVYDNGCLEVEIRSLLAQHSDPDV